MPSGSARTVFVAARKDCNVHSGGVLGGSLFTFRRDGLINTLTYGANSYSAPVNIYSDNNGVGNNNASISGTVIDSAVSPVVVTYKVPAAGGQIQCNLNGVAQTVNQGSGSVTAETGATGFTVGDREDQTDLDWSGWIYEVIVYSRTLTAEEISSVERYLYNKYNTGSSAPFTGLPATQTNSNSILDDGIWKHSYNSSDNAKVIASVKDYCFDLGARNDVVYVDATAGLYNGQRYMRRHYVVKPTLNPVSPKRVRLYYTDADFADLQSYIPSLTSASQLVVTKYTGANEDGVYDPSGGVSVLIPSSQITTGSLYGNNYLEFDVTGFSEFWIHTGNYVLPLQLTSFTGTKKENKANLYWTTENETDLKNFIIERSTNSNKFIPVGSVEAKNLVQNNYQFCDDLSNLLSTTPNLYYRLKQVDKNGQFKYSNVIRIHLTKEIVIQVAPNPVNQSVSILSTEDIKKIILLSLNGQIIKSWIPSLTEHQFHVADVKSGIYILKLQGDNFMQTKKLVIQH